MEIVKQETKKPKAVVSLLKKVDAETAKLLSQLKDRANKKPFGRKVRESEILNVAVRLVTHEHLKEIQEKTYSQQDLLKLFYEDYQKRHGKISMDQFLGKLIKGEIKQQS